MVPPTPAVLLRSYRPAPRTNPAGTSGQPGRDRNPSRPSRKDIANCMCSPSTHDAHVGIQSEPGSGQAGQGRAPAGGCSLFPLPVALSGAGVALRRTSPSREDVHNDYGQSHN